MRARCACANSISRSGPIQAPNAIVSSSGYRTCSICGCRCTHSANASRPASLTTALLVVNLGLGSTLAWVLPTVVGTPLIARSAYLAGVQRAGR